MNNVNKTAINTIMDITIGNIIVTLWNTESDGAEWEDTLFGGWIELILITNDVFDVENWYSASVTPEMIEYN